MHRSGDVMRSDRLKQVMQQLDPNFDERNAGFNRFSKFVTEAGNRGLITVSKLDNGQYEVGPVAGGKTAPAKVVVKVERGGRPGRGRPAEKPSQPAAAPAVEVSEEPGRRRRRSRGRGRDRDREEGKQAPAAKSESTPEGRPEPRRAAAKADAALTLAEAFQLLQSALNELPQPVAHDKVRARMLALLGREDGLMEADRFARFLRQANDAEVADVRKIDDEHYEVLPHRAQLALQARDQMSARAKGGSAAESTTASAEASPGAGPAEPRSVATLRFRRGSRGPLRPSDIPLTGAVKIGGSTPDVPVGAKAIVPPEAPKKAAKKRGSRKKAAPRKAASTA